MNFKGVMIFNILNIIVYNEDIMFFFILNIIIYKS